MTEVTTERQSAFYM